MQQIIVVFPRRKILVIELGLSRSIQSKLLCNESSPKESGFRRSRFALCYARTRNHDSKSIVRSFFLFYLQNQIYRLFFHRHIVTSNRKTFLYLTTVILNSVISVYVEKISINIHVQRHSVARKNILPMKSTNIANTTKMSIGGH